MCITDVRAVWGLAAGVLCMSGGPPVPSWQKTPASAVPLERNSAMCRFGIMPESLNRGMVPFCKYGGMIEQILCSPSARPPLRCQAQDAS